MRAACAAARSLALTRTHAQAAGTRMYETKKENALKTLDKKQTKVEEINKARLPACAFARQLRCTWCNH